MKEKMLSLINELNQATKAYDEGKPYMSDITWDNLYFELVALEKTLGYAFPQSPTQVIHYAVVNNLEKTTHDHPMLSLAKTKSEEEIQNFMNKAKTITMLKMDGLTCSLTYIDRRLVKAETRGNGHVGENVLHNAMVIPSIPKRIARKEKTVIDGEIICSLGAFKQWEDKYANPRNFAAGSIRLLDSKECSRRGLTFVAWDWINGEYNSLQDNLIALKNFGFTTVPFIVSSIFNPTELTTIASDNGYPIDGLVVKYDDCSYYQSCGQTSHHFRGGLAFKFGDDSVTSTLENIEYEVSRTGVLTPVAVFAPVDFKGSTISRASLHNLTVMNEILGTPYKDQELEIIKANMIIPQIVSANKVDNPESPIKPPNYCPSCGEMLEIQCENDSEVLICNNLNCTCRLINRLEHFFSKKGIEAKGLSKATLEKLINWGWVDNIEDVFELSQYVELWKRKPGFGAASVNKILAAIEASKTCTLDKYLVAIGIPLVGASAAKTLAKTFKTWNNFIEAVENDYKFYNLPDFGNEMHNVITLFNYTQAKMIAEKYITFKEEENENIQNISLNNLTFVITGKVNKFKNRDDLKTVIETLGGKVTGSVSKNTNYLINNDIESDSSKNRTAKQLNIPILTEEKFIENFGIIVEK